MAQPERGGSRPRPWWQRWPGAAPVGFLEMLKVGLAAGLAIFVAGGSGAGLLGGGTLPLLASMGASVVILFAVPHSPMARPWAVLGGHGLSCLIGVSCAQGVPGLWTAAALAVGLSVFAMHLARCLHPPGGATALVMVLGGEQVRALGYQFLLTPLALNLAVLLLLARFYALSRKPRRLPVQPHVSPVDPSPLERLGVRPEDLRAALQEHGAFVDVSEGELGEIYQLAASHAQRREFGARTCAAIMSRDVVAVEFGTGLEEAWRLMRQERIQALPVIDRARHVIGIVTFADFFRQVEVEGFDSLGQRLGRLIRQTPGVVSHKPEVVGQIMSAPVVTAREDDALVGLVPVLCERGIHQVPVVDARGKLSGLVTQSDLIAALYREHGTGAAMRAAPAASAALKARRA